MAKIRRTTKFPKFLSFTLVSVFAVLGTMLVVATFALDNTEARAAATGFFFGSHSGTATATTGAGEVVDMTADVVGSETILFALSENPFAEDSGCIPPAVDPADIKEDASARSSATEDPSLEGSLTPTFTYSVLADARLSTCGFEAGVSASASVESEVTGEFRVPGGSALTISIEQTAGTGCVGCAVTFLVTDDTATPGDVFTVTGSISSPASTTIAASEVGGEDLTWSVASSASASCTVIDLVILACTDSELGSWDIAFVSGGGDPTVRRFVAR